MKIKAALFDLDGVLVDTARYHYEAWLVLANQLSIPFTEKENEQLKGISRTESLERLLSFGKMEQKFSEKRNQPLLSKKTIYIFKRFKKWMKHPFCLVQ